MMHLATFLIFMSACVLLAKAAPRQNDPTVAPPSPWFPNRHPITFQTGEKTTLYTTTLSRATFRTEDRTNFRFRVKACSDATVVFRDLAKGDTPGQDPETVTLGASNNTETTIALGNTVRTATTPDVLHCHEFRSFWINWRTELLEVGRGTVVGQGVLVSSDQFPNTRFTYALELSTALATSTAVWEVLENSADELMTGSIDFGYNSVWKDVGDRNFITVHVESCWDARILLTATPYSLEGKVYEIVLNRREDWQSVIRTEVNGGTELDSSPERVLACNENRDFWVSWYSHGSFGTIKVGKGIKYGKNVLLEGHDTSSPVNVRHLAVGSSNNIITWGFEEDMEDTTMVTTQLPPSAVRPEQQYRKVWLESVQTDFMTFSVTACGPVGLHLSTDGDVDLEMGVELVIGAANNTKTLLRPLAEEGNIAEVPTPDILECDLTRWFWFSWRAGYVRFGAGRISQMDVILEGQAPSNTYRSLSVTSFSAPAEWAFKARASENLRLIQSPDQVSPLDNWRTVRTRQDLTFQVKACSDVTLLLSPYPGIDATSYHFRVRLNVLNTNRSVIDILIGDAETGRELASKEVADLLSCDSYRELYVSWWAGRLHVGRGRNQGRLTSSFISAQHINTAYIKALSLRAEPGAKAKWVVQGDVGDVFVYDTSPSRDFEHFVTFLPGADYVTFDVTTGSAAQVMLMKDFVGILETKFLYVIISGWDNTMSAIMTMDGTIVANVTHDRGLLDTKNTRTFWIRWDNTSGLIQVGGGNVLLAEGPFLTWTNPDPFPFSAMAFRTSTDEGESFAGRWYIRQHMGHTTLFPTHTPIIALNREVSWRSVEHTRSLFFSVKGAADKVSLTLTEHQGILSTNALTLVIGDKNNTVSSLQSEDSGDAYVEVNTPNILDKENFKDFWVSWNEGEVQFGKGNIPGFNRLFNFQLIAVLNIRAVRFSTAFGEDGQWMVQMWDGAK